MTVCRQCGTANPDAFRYCGGCGTAIDGVIPDREMRKTVTVVFCDVIGSTALGERLDPEALRGVLARYFEEIRGVVERHGGSVEKFIGDAVMAVFGVPLVHEDDALRAVRAAAEMRERLPAIADELGIELRFRTGVNTGEAVVGTGDVLVTGDAVNVAARLEQHATAGEILLGRLTYDLVRDAVEVEPAEPLQAKGKSDPVEAFRLLRVDRQAAGRARRMDLPLVGRERELGILRQAFERAVAERSCHLFTLLGPAGIGKSRLIASFLSDAGSGATIAAGRCLPYGDGITFWPLVEILRGIGDAGEAALERVSAGDAASSRELFVALRRALEAAAGPRPLIVVIDDVQWGEPMLLDMIEHVARLSRGAPILLVCVARPELVDERAMWGGGTLNASTMLLAPLTPDECRRLVATLDSALDAKLADEAIHASEGNPLFLEEMVALARESGAAAVPPTIQAVLSARIERLAAADRAVLECGSIEGEVFHRGGVAVLARESGVDVDDALAELVQKELVRPDRAQLIGEEGYRFSHLLIREAAYEALPKARRADMHERFAGWLAQHGGTLVEADQILGWHLEETIRLRREAMVKVDPELSVRAAGHLHAAARSAVGRVDLAAAETLLRRVLALADRDGDRRVDATVDLAEVLDRRLAVAEAKALLDDHAMLERGGTRAAMVLLQIRYDIDSTDIRSWVDHDIPILRKEFERAGDERGLAGVAATEARMLQHLGQMAAALQAADRSAQHASACADRFALAEACNMALGLAVRGPEPAAEIRARLDQTKRDRSDMPLDNVAWAESILAQYRGDFDTAYARIRDFFQILGGTGQELARAGEKMADLELASGDPESAIRTLTRTRETLAGLDDHELRSTHSAMLSDALYRAGRSDDAERMAAEALAETTADDVINFIIVDGVLAQIHADRGDHEIAITLAGRSLRTAQATDRIAVQGDAERTLAGVLARAGRISEALEAARRAHSLYTQKGDVASARRVEAWMAPHANTTME
jgi:class 3 adenylate cyclase/tetratricopeptide (TPR) repeat protein